MEMCKFEFKSIRIRVMGIPASNELDFLAIYTNFMK